MLMVCTILLLSLFGCSSKQEVLSLEQMREKSITCFSEHKSDMIKIIDSQSAIGETNWCEGYDLLRDGVYEFDLYCWGFTGTNIQAGIRYISNDTPDSEYIPVDDNDNVYTYEKSPHDKFYLERIEENWFYFYSEYDF